jgi:hypothetical protein
MTQPGDLAEREHEKAQQQHEARRRLEEEELRVLREKKRLAEGAGAGPARTGV